MVPTGGNGISIVAGRSPEKRQAAWEFLRFSQQPAQVARVAEMTGYLPYTKGAGAAMASLLAKEPNRKVALDQMAWSRPQSSIQTVPRAVDVYYDAMLQVLEGNADPKTVLPQVQKQVQTILVEDGYKK